MHRAVAICNLLQAAVYAALAVWLWERWWVAGFLAGVAVMAQIVAGAALLRGTLPIVRWGSAITLLIGLFLAGLHLQVAAHLVLRFGTGNSDLGWQILGIVAVAAPWILAFPAWQLAATGRLAPFLGVGALLLSVGPATAVVADRPVRDWPAVDGASALAFLRDRGPRPEGPGPVALVVSSLRAGKWTSQAIEADDLGTALSRVTVPFPADGALRLDVATLETARWTPWMAAGPAGSPGEDGLRQRGALVSPLATWRGAKQKEVFFPVSLAVPALDGDTWVRFSSWQATRDDLVALHQGWSTAPLNPAACRAAAFAGARMLARNLRPDGRFSYIVSASGKVSDRYNWPRHAGTSWFLARAAAESGDPALRDAARSALARLDAESRETADGRRFVHDPMRTDHSAWIGSSALGFLAWQALGEGEPQRARLAAFLASAVGDDGQVRGVMRLDSGVWRPQPDSSYAAGQGLLGILAADAAGFPVTEARVRAEAWADGAYWPDPAGRLATLDEHWMCLADLAAYELHHQRTGDRICQAFLTQSRWLVPIRAPRVRLPAGGVAANAEAFVAAAKLDRLEGRPPRWEDEAAAYGRLLLDNVYRDVDVPRLSGGPALLGGLHDDALSTDVRIDAVQHAGMALLGLADLGMTDP